ncbi:cyclophilin-like fold protein [Enterococcus sp. AZ103]|uniref:cyclophilin-like fold protein n=1 Tax=Enterococcus sp. AZ103 TaxID=2774628 RepID=UPI003F22B91A
MRKRLWKVQKGHLLLQLGDTLSEILIENNFFEKKLKSFSIKAPLVFNRTAARNYYFSESLTLEIQDQEKYFSTEGDVCYFPDWQSLAICLEDEDFTLGIRRYKIGKIKGDYCKIQTLKAVEEAKLYWEYDLD